MDRDRARTLRDVLALALLAVATSGAIVRVTSRDSVQALALIYYAFPLIVIAACLAAAAFVWRRARPRSALSSAVGAAVLAGAWIANAWFANPCTSERGSPRVLFWNVGHGRAGWQEIAAAVRDADADLIGLVEAGKNDRERIEFWRRHFPDFQVLLPGMGIVLLTKGKIESSSFHDLAVGFGARADLDQQGQRLRVVLADVVSLPAGGRQRALERVLDLAGSEPGMRTIVMGDFNTPIDSVWFRGLRQRFRHAFETAGHGILATWPAPLPVVAVDHVFISETIEATCARLRLSGLSDHLQVVVDLRFAEARARRRSSAAENCQWR